MSDIDLLMQRIEEINTKTPPLPADDIEALIAYHRQSGAGKTTVKSKAAAGQKVDLASVLGLKPAAAAPMFKIKVKL